MFTKADLEARAEEIKNAINKIASDIQQLGVQHNAHLGALSEIQNLIQKSETAVSAVHDVIEEVKQDV